jgi:hypothetical protein
LQGNSFRFEVPVSEVGTDCFSLVIFDGNLYSMGLPLWAKKGTYICLIGEDMNIYTWRVESDMPQQQTWQLFVIFFRIRPIRIAAENKVCGKMDEAASFCFAAFCQMLHGSNVDGICFCMVCFAIIGDGEGGGIDYDIRLHFLEKLFHRLAVAYIRTDETIVTRMGTDVVVQGTARCLIRQVAGQIILDASAGKTVGAYHQYFLSCHRFCR